MSNVDYASWSSSDLSIAYNLPVFHEIDFAVSDGYRRIPHGGVETGGLLFGTREAGRLQIEAFRLIECEHAFGPSFHLSERDIEHIRAQLLASRTDPELSNFQPLGWFIAHTRSELVMTDREAAIFDQLFPEAGTVTLLVKPEKFKPTRFAFLPRAGNSLVPRDGTQRALILPLLGRAGKAAKPSPEMDEPLETPQRVPAPSPMQPVSPPPPPAMRPPEPSYVQEERVAEPGPPAFREPPPEISPATSEVELKPAPRAEPIEFPRRQPTVTSPLGGISGQPLTTPEPGVHQRARQRQQAGQDEDRSATASHTLHRVMLGLAVVCAAVIAWGVYLRMQPGFIPVSAVARNGALVIMWPSSFTRDTENATVRVNDGLALNLPQSDRISGMTVVSATAADSVKVELSVHQWLHEARGIVRYVRLPSPPSKPVAPAPTRSFGGTRRTVTPRSAPVFPPIGSEGLTQPRPQAEANPEAQTP